MFTAYVSQIDALSGKFAVSGFADGTPLTYQVSSPNSTGSGAHRRPVGQLHRQRRPGQQRPHWLRRPPSLRAPAAPSGAPSARPSRCLTGSLSATGLTPGVYPFAFGLGLIASPISFGFNGSYDGATTAGVLGFLNGLLGTSFVDPTGKGTLAISGTITDTSRT